MLDAMFERKTVEDERIIEQGDDGDNFYVIDKGVFDIYVKIDGADKKVGTTFLLDLLQNDSQISPITFKSWIPQMFRALFPSC